MAESDSGALVRQALDRAIANLADEEYGRLAEGMNRGDQTASVEKALRSLMALQKGYEPDYNSEWVSLFYVTWFQPRQVHLAYAALRQQVAERQIPPHVIDYGCGAWAVQFALAVLLAEEQELQGLSVHGIDPNEPMREIGMRLWGKFQESVAMFSSNDFLGVCLQTTLESMDGSCSCHASLDEAAGYVQPVGTVPARFDHWLTAVHSIYETNQADLKNVLERIYAEGAPGLAVVTFRQFQNFYGIWPRNRPDWSSFFANLGFSKARIDLAWSGDFPETTRWRRNLAERLPELHWKTKRLLNKHSVTWDPLGRLAADEDVVMIRS